MYTRCRGTTCRSRTALGVTFETSPDQYKHWKLSFDGPVATLAMDVKEDAGLRPNDYKLKLNSYDLGVDIELADALQRIRFEHPEVHAVVVTSLKPRIFCAGANIFMLGTLESRLQGELLQVHQRDPPRHGGHERAQRHQVSRRAQRHLCRRRLRAGARVRRNLSSSTMARRRWRCRRRRCSACCPAPAA